MYSKSWCLGFFIWWTAAKPLYTLCEREFYLFPFILWELFVTGKIVYLDGNLTQILTTFPDRTSYPHVFQPSCLEVILYSIFIYILIILLYMCLCMIRYFNWENKSSSFRDMVHINIFVCYNLIFSLSKHVNKPFINIY